MAARLCLDRPLLWIGVAAYGRTCRRESAARAALPAAAFYVWILHSAQLPDLCPEPLAVQLL